MAEGAWFSDMCAGVRSAIIPIFLFSVAVIGLFGVGNQTIAVCIAFSGIALGVGWVTHLTGGVEAGGA